MSPLRIVTLPNSLAINDVDYDADAADDVDVGVVAGYVAVAAAAVVHVAADVVGDSWALA